MSDLMTAAIEYQIRCETLTTSCAAPMRDPDPPRQVERREAPVVKAVEGSTDRVPTVSETTLHRH